MPRRLILFRHAKSSWPEGVEDHERPLSERGRRDAPAMAKWLARQGLVPSLALVSTARRTQETWALAAPELGGAEKRDVAAIYEAPAERLLDLIRETESSIATLLLVGHNPGMEDLAALLMRPRGGAMEDRLALKYPTAGIAVLSLIVEDWRDTAPQTAVLEQFVTPKTLTAP